MADRLVTLAAVAGAHGTGGELRLKLFAESVESLKRYKQFDVGGRMLTLTALRDGPNGPIARFAGISDRSAAEALRGTVLAVPRGVLPALPEGEYYYADLIGLPCVSTDGAALGEIVAVENFGAGDVIEIARADGTRFMVPMRPEAVPEWNTGRLVVDAAFLV